MNYIAISHDEYLAHHGVKGMKWGVRRQQRKEARAKRRERRKTTNAILWNYYPLEREFDNTPSGRKLKSNYTKWLNILDSDREYNAEHVDSFMKAHRDYAGKQAAYVYDSLRKTYSEESIRDALTHPSFGYSMKIPENQSTREAFIEDHITTHYNNAFG